MENGTDMYSLILRLLEQEGRVSTNRSCWPRCYVHFRDRKLGSLCLSNLLKAPSQEKAEGQAFFCHPWVSALALEWYEPGLSLSVHPALLYGHIPLNMQPLAP